MSDFKPPFLENLDPEKTFLIKGSSMLPFLKTGDMLFIEKVAPSHLRTGDIITFDFEKKEKYIVHRLIKIQNTDDGLFLATKGDNNLSYDRLVKFGDFVGKGRLIIRGSKTINLLSPFNRIVSKCYLLLSKLNLNLTKLKKNRLSKWFKRKNFTAGFLFWFLPKTVKNVVYPQSGNKEKVLKVFAGNHCFAQGILEINNKKNIRLKKWHIKYPFYKTTHCEKLIANLLKYSREQNKDHLIIEKVKAGNPLKSVLKKMKLKNLNEKSQEDEFSIPLDGLDETFFLQYQ